MAIGMMRVPGSRAVRFGVAAAMIAAGLGLGGAAWAQQKEAPKGKQPAAKEAPKKEAAKEQSAWVKLCEEVPFVQRDKDGKETRDARKICLTHHERLDGNSGMVLVSAAIRQIDKQDKEHLMVMVPLGMSIKPGLRAAVYPKELWEKVQKNEKVDEKLLKPLELDYAICHPAGCTAEIESTPELVKEMKGGGGLIILAINAAGQPIAFPIPLTGFDGALAGAAIDNKVYAEARGKLMQQIRQRQIQMAEEARKQQAPAAAAPAAAAPAPAKK
jgi:invasion protein IalB